MELSEKLKAMIKKTESDRIDLCFKVTSEYLNSPMNTLKIADLTMQAGRLAERVETLNEIRGMVGDVNITNLVGGGTQIREGVA